MDLQRLKSLAGLIVTEGVDRSIVTRDEIIKVNDGYGQLDEALNSILQQLHGLSSKLNAIGAKANNQTMLESHDIKYNYIRETAKQVEKLIDDAKRSISEYNKKKQNIPSR